MFKITIDNEEVITDKDFTIEEEMLNTPSVILNNVYPKEWETDKDYLNFYHPNEYSKCKIYDEEIIPASEGLTVEGTDFSITYDNTKEYNLLSLKGDTSQSGTPTPTSPIPVDTVTGRQQISVAGKNLFDKNTSIVTGKTWTNTGTETNLTNCFVQESYIPVTPSTAYTISTTNNYSSTTDFRLMICEYDTNKNFIRRNIGTVGGGVTTKYTITTGSTTHYVRLGASTVTIDELQLEKGNQATTYEAYKGHNYEINLGKNLFNLGTFTPKTNQTMTISQNDTSSIIFNGTASTTLNFWFGDLSMPLSKGTYYFSLSNSDNNIVYFLRSNGTNIFSSRINGSFTLANDVVIDQILIQVYNGASKDNQLVNIQLEKGSQATSYAKYKTPIELCKIGNYQDYIFKNTTDSDYYDNTLEEGAWYLHKDIGKVVLNGTETWTISNSGTQNWYYSNINSNINIVNDSTTNNSMSDYYQINAVGNSNTNQGMYIVKSTNQIRIRYGTQDTTTNFKTWLSNHNVKLYYVLDTPTTELIEDTELLGQLEEVSLLNGLNNISVSSPYLTTPIKIHYNFNEEIINQDLYFCGVVKNSGNISLNPREPHFQSLQVLSYKTFLSEGETLDFVIYQKTIREAIEQVVSAIQDYGFIVGDINILNPDEIIGAYSTKDKSAYDVFQYIADITQSRWTTRMIDEDTIAIDFYDPSLMQLGTTLDYTQEFFEDNLIDDMSYSYGTNDYRNKQVMTSQEVYSNINQIQNIVANGYQTQFNTEQQIGKINSIKISGVDYTFATNTEKDMGVIADFYYSAGNNYFESASTISIGTVIVIDYLPIVEGRQIITNSNEIDRVANSTGVKGVVARYENRNDATTSTELQLIGQSYIKYKGVPEIVLTVITRKNIWDVGQRVQFNAPINELAVMYMVRKKSIHRITTIDTIFYTYELVSSFNSETAVNYFDNQRAKANGNIGEGEYISRNIDIQSTANIIFYDTQANEITVVGDNELNCTLESPFVS